MIFPLPHQSTYQFHKLALLGSDYISIPNGPDILGGDEVNNQSEAFSTVLQAHINFKTCLLPEEVEKNSFGRACRAEVNAIEIFFPGALSAKVRICFAAWLAFACAMDDILETLPSDLGQAVLCDCIEIIQGRPADVSNGTKGHAGDARIQHLTRTLHQHVTCHLPQETCDVFFHEVCGVLYAHIDEFLFLDGRIPQDLDTYMSIRSRTISLNPFFEVIKREYFPTSWQPNRAWDRLQEAVSSAAGLQNDLVGLERDMKNDEQMNAVIVLMRSQTEARSADETHALLARCVDTAVDEHNRWMETIFRQAARILEMDGGDQSAAETNQVVQHIVTIARTHLTWCTSAKRYMVRFDHDV
ncbi:unnamed protein product [Clonostachys solani]|uniref:Isoprenoid synthase domain-containing protein n=1 Tax=Clonostachys solani TaxID=160281 RepID=A0A9N9Z234_9HYPO|nr:unnamed protein product [Clonostachys solani]